MTPLAESLLKCKVEGNIVSLPPISDGALPNYADVRKALLNAGAKYKRNTFVFESEAQPYIDRLVNGDSVNIKKEFQFFSTPKEVAEMMMEQLPEPENSDYSEKVLEPSAGEGALIKGFYEYIGREIPVDCFELMDINRKKLAKIPRVNILGDDFLKCDLREVYNIVIANPPFTKNQDIDHIRKMFTVLKPGGTLVTLSSNSWKRGSQKKQLEFKEWLEWLNAETTDIEPGAFKESGTEVGAIMIVIHKPAEAIEKNFLREYKGYKIFEAQANSDNMNLKRLSVEGIDSITFVFDNVQPKSVNTAIEAAKTQIDSFIKRNLLLPASYDEKGLSPAENKALESTDVKSPQKSKGKSKKNPAKIQTEKQNPETAVRKCRVCGCTDNDCSQCIAKTGSPCHWVEDDLCSACVEELPIKVTDTRASQQTETSVSTPVNNTDMNFFEQLGAHLGDVDMTIRFFKKNGVFTLNIMPGAKSTIKPIIIKGAPEELDKEFFNTIAPGVKEITGIISNMEEIKKEAVADAEKSKKEAEQKKDKKPEVKKPAAKKKPAQTPVKKTAKPASKKPAEKIKKKPVAKPPVEEKPKEPSLFEEGAIAE